VAVSVDAKLQWVSWQGEVKQSWQLEQTVFPDSNTIVWQLDEDVDAHELKTLPLEKAHIEVSSEGSQITLMADKPAFFVHLGCDADGLFNDSSFTLLTNKPVTMEFLVCEVTEMAASLRVAVTATIKKGSSHGSLCYLIFSKFRKFSASTCCVFGNLARSQGRTVQQA
jgi:beta-mannosidase